jgi:hypothetical protein
MDPDTFSRRGAYAIDSTGRHGRRGLGSWYAYHLLFHVQTAPSQDLYPTAKTNPPAGGIGFIGAGTDTSDLSSHLLKAQDLLASAPLKDTHSNNTLTIGIGFINWGADLSTAIPLIAQYRPCAVWFFAPTSLSSLLHWTQSTRQASPSTKIWVQIGA